MREIPGVECTDDLGQRVLEELLEAACFHGSGKLYDAAGASAEEMEVLQQLQQQGMLTQVSFSNRPDQLRFQFTAQAEVLVEVGDIGRGVGRGSSYVVCRVGSYNKFWNHGICICSKLLQQPTATSKNMFV